MKTRIYLSPHIRRLGFSIGPTIGKRGFVLNLHLWAWNWQVWS